MTTGRDPLELEDGQQLELENNQALLLELPPTVGGGGGFIGFRPIYPILLYLDVFGDFRCSDPVD